MSLLFETIKLQNRQLFNLYYHNQRLNESRFALFGIAQPIDLQDFIKIPANLGNDLYRCRVSYAQQIESVAFFPYQFKHPKRIKLVENLEISYPHKFENRQCFQKLLDENPDFDEVIITQNGYITDATFANLAFFDGTNWFTPTTYLLKGTKRSYLIDNKQLVERIIKVSDLKNFKKIALVNAMRGLELAYNFVFDEDIIIS